MLEPDYKSRARQADVEARQGKISVADPRISRMRFPDQGAESWDVFVIPLPLPDLIETYDRSTCEFSKLLREGSFPGSRTSQDDNSRHAER